MTKYKKHGIEFITLDRCTNDDLRVEEKGYDTVVNPILKIKQFKIMLESHKLLLEFNQLTTLQQQILLYNVILKIPMREIAQKLKISHRMVEKHKANAIRKLRRSLDDGTKK